VFALAYVDGGMPHVHVLRVGETLIGRTPACDLIINAPTVSRRHARLRVAGGRVFVRDTESTYGTAVNGVPVVDEHEIASGDTLLIGQIEITLIQDIPESELLSESHQVLGDTGNLVRRVDDDSAVTHEVPKDLNAAADAAGAAEPRPERRGGRDRRKVDLGRLTGERRTARDRRGGRIVRLLTEISKTLVTVQPLAQILGRVVDLVFDVIPADRTYLLLRESNDQPLTARVMRNRDGSVPTNVTLSRTLINIVTRDRVAMLAKDARYDPRLDISGSIQAMNIRSFLCAPLWNRNEVIGVLYCDNGRSKKFTVDDLEVFTALSNYAAVAIEQARMSQQLIQETWRRERLQRYHSPGVIKRILKDTDADQRFVTQERDVTVMFCDIVGFTTLCEQSEPAVIGDLLNSFFGRMADVIFDHDGTLDKFIGDAILAVFGAPFDQPDHPARCVAAALAMRRQLAQLNLEQSRNIRMRIAINTGRALTGDIGSPKRREFTVLGDVVNTAARLEASVAQPDQIVISDKTRQRLGDAFQLRPLGVVSLRDRGSNLATFEVIG
jgi:adenylate cyclase